MYWVRCVHSTYKSINLPMQKLMCGILPSRERRVGRWKGTAPAATPPRKRTAGKAAIKKATSIIGVAFFRMRKLFDINDLNKLNRHIVLLLFAVQH